MQAFDYRRAATLEEAEALLSGAGEAALLAGGQTLIPALKQCLAAPDMLIDIGRLAELRFIREEGGALVIGAATSHAEVAASEPVKRFCPALAELAGHIGDPQVRNRGTIGGATANNDPAADYPAACLALNARITTNRREIAADDFFTGLFETALEENEIIVRIAFPPAEQAAYVKFPQAASRYALTGVFAARREGEARVAVTGAGANGVFRWKEAEQALSRRFAPEALDGLAAGTEGLSGDLHADPAYRAHLIGVLTRRAVAAAA